MKHFQLSTKENIWVFDDVFNLNEVFYFNSFAYNSNYKLGAQSIVSVSLKEKDTFFQSPFSENDLNNFGLLNCEGFNKFDNIIKEKKPISSWILASTQLTRYSYHVDQKTEKSGITLIYYINNEWEKNWGGETIFCNSHDGDAEYSVSFKTNRVVLFDSHCVHKPCPTTIDADPWRFTFVCQFY
jgi:hypothetical protein